MRNRPENFRYLDDGGYTVAVLLPVFQSLIDIAGARLMADRSLTDVLEQGVTTKRVDGKLFILNADGKQLAVTDLKLPK